VAQEAEKIVMEESHRREKGVQARHDLSDQIADNARLRQLATVRILRRCLAEFVSYCIHVSSIFIGNAFAALQCRQSPKDPFIIIIIIIITLFLSKQTVCW
jgi:hypothetical protein